MAVGKNLSLAELMQCLSEIGVESPRSEALLALDYLTGKSRAFWLSGGAFEADNETVNRINNVFAGRKKGIPIQYLLGTAPFRDLDLSVSPDVLIPRPETEILVDWVLKKLPQNGKFLDLGTGSGAIAISVAVERPDVQVTAVDISSKALNVAKQNSLRYQVDKRIKLIQSDLFTDLSAIEKFDVIGANLPYVTDGEYQDLAIEVKNNEPKLALVADEEGLGLIKKAIYALPEHLCQGGAAIFEMSPWQIKKALGFFSDIPDGKAGYILDLCNRARFVTWEK